MYVLVSKVRCALDPAIMYAAAHAAEISAARSPRKDLKEKGAEKTKNDHYNNLKQQKSANMVNIVK